MKRSGTYFFNIPIFYMKSAADAGAKTAKKQSMKSAADAGAKTAKKQSASQLRNTLCFSPSMRLIRLQYTP